MWGANFGVELIFSWIYLLTYICQCIFWQIFAKIWPHNYDFERCSVAIWCFDNLYILDFSKKLIHHHLQDLDHEY
jgi:hypothetical protein